MEVDWKKMYEDKNKELLANINKIENERKCFDQRYDYFRKKEGKYVELLKVIKDTMKTEGHLGKSFENAIMKSIAQRSDIDAGILFREPKQRYKIVLIGPGCAGKTALLKRKEEGVFKDSLTTIAVDFKKISFEEHPGVEFQFWDTCGFEKFWNLTRQYVKRCDVAVVCYDMSNDEYIKEKTEPFFKMCVDEGIEPKRIVLAGLKEDMGTTNREFVDSMKRKYGYQFYLEASARTGKGVDEFFRRTAMYSAEVW